MPEPDCFLRYHISHATRNFTSGKSDVYVLVAAARSGFKMVLRPTAAATRGFTMVSFTEAVSRRNTFVGGTCAPPSALLVIVIIMTRSLWQISIVTIAFALVSLHHQYIIVRIHSITLVKKNWRKTKYYIIKSCRPKSALHACHVTESSDTQ